MSGARGLNNFLRNKVLIVRDKDEKSFERLRKILLGDPTQVEKLEIELCKLKELLENRETLISSLDPVIMDLLERKISSSKDDMAEALAPVMGEAIKKQVIETKEDVVDALYPVIGKTIRKSVGEAMRDLIKSVNSRIESTIRRLFFPKWLQAKLLGVSKAELLIKDTLPFYIEEIFLIHKETGILIAHVSSKCKETTVDQELISGMLTAIKDFVAQAFKRKEQELNEIHYGDAKILLEIGLYSYLALVVSGFEPKGFAEEVQKLDHRIHNRYCQTLRHFNGNVTELSSVKSLLESFVGKYATIGAESDGRAVKPYLLYILGFILFALIILFLTFLLPTYFANQELIRKVKNEIKAVSWARVEDVDCSVLDKEIVLSGRVHSYLSRSRIDSLVRAIPEIGGVKNKIKVVVPSVAPESILNEAKRRMAPYDTLRFFIPKIIIEQDHLIIFGFVPDVTIKREIGLILSEIAGVKVVTNNLSVVNEQDLTEFRAILSKNAIYFKHSEVSFPEAQSGKLDAVVELFNTFGRDVARLVVRGYSDDLDDYHENLGLAKERADTVANRLLNRHLSGDDLIILTYGEHFPKYDEAGMKGRNVHSCVEFDIILGR